MVDPNRNPRLTDATDAAVGLKLDPESTDLKQTRCCYRAQADGIPCPKADCTCETCRYFELLPRLGR